MRQYDEHSRQDKGDVEMRGAGSKALAWNQ
jgi:hypothetical protein